ncbi:TonB-dependent receptor [Chitinophaga pinensis]|uniref:TonB-dependent siderophore receptor n=1 Tax=Chitinophaga pinensis (strain ATCC 43595 / DSM 2588 / LMG 13176 / NBRC 15968 / NCIMB 11800 / UQM 2034) TaxID=485918 RepID=A0A979GQF1_CHIPD|nr:TonB-dependent receptor [Chitinophaga pinensis]ACU59958.1 TonB-dependent siderophore receptor [Chitinophaga pinensis DSM 2588]
MRRLQAVFFLLFLTSVVNAQQQHGSISGIVSTKNGEPVAYVTVGVKGTSYGATTTDKGNFRINRINPGTYTISVSAVNIISQEKQVTVNAGQNEIINFELDLSNTQLKEVMVNARSNSVKMDNPSQSLRLQEPLIQVAQNIQVVSAQSIREQQIISMSDGIIRNVSGAVRLEHWGDLYTNITMRGSQIKAFRNGFNVVSSYWGPLTEDMSFVDHIEFVKGPAGFMISAGDPSGLYNVVTKKPTGQTKNEFSYTVGSFNLNRASLDLDGKLSKDGKLLYRLNLSGQNKGSFRANEFNDRYAIAPVLSYQVDDKTKLTVEYVYQRANMSDVGSYYIFTPKGYGALPRDLSDLPSGLPPTKINDHSFTVNLQHQINENWKLTAQAAYYKYSQDGTSMWADSVEADGRYYRNVGIWEAKSAMSLGQIFLNGKVTTGPVVHKILAGIDLGDKRYTADYAQTHSLDTGSAPFDPNHPNLDYPSNGYPVYDRTSSLEARAAAGFGLINSNYSSLYLQDELGFLNNRIRLTLAGRYTYISQSDFGTTSKAKRFTPRVGLSVSIDDFTAVYGLYDQAFTPQAGAVSIGKLKPLTGNNIEFGIKRDWLNGKWNTTVAVYRILKENELTADPNAPANSGLSIVFGQRRAQGIEFDLRGELLPGLDLTANYALTEAKVSKVNPGISEATGIKVGDVVPGYSKHVANAWLTYKLLNGALKGAGVSAGFTYLAGRETDTWSVGLQRLPDYFKMEGGLFWEGSKLRIGANVFNIFDKYLYSGSYYSYLNAYYYQAEAPRNYRLSVSYKF